MAKKKIWARVGMSFEVDEQAFLEDATKELSRALGEEKLHLDGETYVPYEILEEYGFPESLSAEVDMPLLDDEDMIPENQA